ncbi:hypothetical protein ACTFIV_007585 [Dictyostelium citrinum]
MLFKSLSSIIVNKIDSKNSISNLHKINSPQGVNSTQDWSECDGAYFGKNIRSNSECGSSESISTLGNVKSSSKSSMIVSSGSSSSQGSNNIECFTGCGIIPIRQTSISIDIDINLSITHHCGCCGGCGCRC